MSVFVYDGKLRRRIERDYGWTGSAWLQTNEIHYIYDGNVILQQRDSNNLPTLTLTRGNDLSGSLQGAGGIGGLLAMTENALTINSQPSTGTSYYHSDGNGNVTMLINGNQAVVAKAEFDPYGNFLSVSGSQTGINPFWFSSKPIHWASGKYDFCYRWYSPQLDRWVNRDPIGERGGINLYGYVQANPINLFDSFGLLCCPDGQNVVTDDAGQQCCSGKIQTITLWNYTPDFPSIPHTFIETPNGTFGFYPAWRESPLAPGAVNNDANHPRTGGKSYKVCPQTLNNLLQSINQNQGGWGEPYVLPSPIIGDNCTSWACARLASAGLTPPTNPYQPLANPWGNQLNSEPPAMHPLFQGK